MGGYISQDPIRLKGGHLLYSYVNNVNGVIDILGLLKKNEIPVQKNEVTTYREFKRKSVPGDDLEGHEILQHAVLVNEGLVDGARLSGSASKDNPVIALDAETHSLVNAKQLEAGTQTMNPIDNIEANAKILKDVGIDDVVVADLEKKAKKHYDSLCNQ